MYKVNELLYEYFTVTDENLELVTGLSNDSFTHELYNPNGVNVSSSMTIYIDELNNGRYRLSLTPDLPGKWYLIVSHPLHFPWGKESEIIISKNDIDSIAELLLRSIGLMQENYYLDSNMFDTQGNLISSRIRLYDSAVNVGSDTGVEYTYSVSATYIPGTNILSTYKVIKG